MIALYNKLVAVPPLRTWLSKLAIAPARSLLLLHAPQLKQLAPALQQQIAEAEKDIAAKHNVSTAQVVFRWENQKGVVPVTATCNEEHAKGDLASFDFKLADADQQCEAIINGPQCAPMRQAIKKAELILAVINANDDPEEAVTAFCALHMAGAGESCGKQLLPHVTSKIEAAISSGSATCCLGRLATSSSRRSCASRSSLSSRNRSSFSRRKRSSSARRMRSSSSWRMRSSSSASRAASCSSRSFSAAASSSSTLVQGP